MPRTFSLVLLMSCVISWQVAPAAQSSDEPEANPGRPTVSTPATLPPVGYLQFETGFGGSGDSPGFTSRFSFINVTKLSVTPRIELLTSVEPIVRFTSDRATKYATADYFLGAQVVFMQGKDTKPTLAASYFRRVYDGGAPEPDYGSPTNAFFLLASSDVKGFHYDVNVFFNELIDKTVRRAQYGQSLTISHPLRHAVTVSGEIWRFTQPFSRSNAIGNLWALSYTARKPLVFDVGFNHGLTGGSTRWVALCGFTYLLPHRLWGR
jgi:hypothetical protein